jgi:hypothetical protein
MSMELGTGLTSALIKVQGPVSRTNAKCTLQTPAETLDALIEETNLSTRCHVIQVHAGEFQFRPNYLRDLCAKLFCQGRKAFVLSKEIRVSTRSTRQTVAISTAVFPEVMMAAFAIRTGAAPAVNATARLPLRFHR